MPGVYQRWSQDAVCWFTYQRPPLCLLNEPSRDRGWDMAIEAKSSVHIRPSTVLALRSREAARALSISERLLATLVAEKRIGVSPASLQHLDIGWTGRCWAFPMRGRDSTVCGIRIRTPSGEKFSERGGKEGLFVPSVLSGTGALVIAEGPTDCAALLDLGFDAIGRPSCRGGVRLIADFVRRGDWKRHVIFADADGPGLDGALALARVLAPLSHDVRVVVPPAKDARAWKNAGATRENVLDLIGAAPPIRLSVRRAAR